MTDHVWDNVKLKLSVNALVSVRVIDQKPFGLLVDLDCGVQGIIERIGLSKQGLSIEQFPIGSRLDAEVLGFRDWSQQVELRARIEALHNG